MPTASHSNDDLKQRVAQASHDLGNLLGVVLNYSTLLTRQITDPAVLTDIDQIRIAAERAADIARNLVKADSDAARLGGI